MLEIQSILLKKLSLLLPLIFWNISSIYSQEIEQSIVFLSNVYSEKEFNKKTFEKYQSIIKSSDHKIISVFLGGYHAKAEEEAVSYLEGLSNDHSFFAFVPGYEEWEKDLYNPEKKIVELNSSISELLEEDSYLLPEGGCPGPYEIEISEDLVLILFNDQWLISDYEVPKVDEGCKYARKLDFLLELKQSILQNTDKRIILASTNPLESSGPKGGNSNITFSHLPLKLPIDIFHFRFSAVFTLPTEKFWEIRMT